MREGTHGQSGKRGTVKAQAGKQLCVSETIFPDGSRHSLNMVYGGMHEDGGLKPAPQRRMAGGEFIDFRRLSGIAPETARTAGLERFDNHVSAG